MLPIERAALPVMVMSIFSQVLPLWAGLQVSASWRGGRVRKEQPGPSRATAVSDGPASAALACTVLNRMGSVLSE
jgi:hypothetical protein